jgi:tetratricopeptide (TPR) repeat protein
MQRQQAEAARRLADQQRQQAEFRLAAADELLASSGKVEELRQCLASTARLATRPPPPASREFFVGRWHVDQGTGSTDVDWRADGTCDTRSIFTGTQSLDMQADVCTWQFEKTGADAFVVTFQSKLIGDNFRRRLPFKIINPVRIHNVEDNYDAFRIVCPAQELDAREKDLATRQRLADANSGNPQHQHALSASHIDMGDVLTAQGRHKAALEHYAAGLAILTRGDPANQAWRRDLAGIYERMGRVHKLQNENTEALDAYKQSLAFRQGLADANRGNAQLQSELAVTLYQMSTVSEPAAAKDALRKSLAVVEALERDRKLTDVQKTWPAFLRGEIAKLP